MAVTLNIYDKGQSAPISTLTSTLAWIGVSSSGNTPGTIQSVYQFSAPGVIPSAVGYGPGPEGVAAGVRVSQTTQLFVRINGSMPGTVSAVSQTGTGPLFTITGTPYDSATPIVTITRGGPQGTAMFEVAMDGATNGVPTTVPSLVAAQASGTTDTSTWTSPNYTALNTLTLIVTPSNGLVETVTFSGTTATNFLSQINTVIGPAAVVGTVDVTSFTWTSLGTNTLNFVTGDGTVVPVTFATPSNQTAALATINTALGAHGTASVVTQGGHAYLVVKDSLATTASYITVNPGTANAALGLPATTTTFHGAQAAIVGGRYLQITDGAPGPSSALTLAGTSLNLLGLTAGSTSGAAATYQIPATGLTLTFPTGTYILGEQYSWTQTEPRFSVADLSAAMGALQGSGLYFRDIVLLSNPIDGVDTRGLANQMATSLATLRGALPKIVAVGMMNSAIGSPTAIQANDANVQAAMLGMTDDYVCVAHGDAYMQGTAISGSFRRPLVYSLGIRAAAYPISSDPGNREQPQLEETSMVAPNLVTLARNEDAAVIQMQSTFTVARNEQGAGYFVRGITRSTSPKFTYLPIIRTACEAARVLYTKARKYENASRFLNPNGTIRESDAVAIENYLTGQTNLALGNDISAVRTSVDRKGVVAVTNALNISQDIQHLAYFYTVNLSLGVVDIFT
jgi:hypothetical protein